MESTYREASVDSAGKFSVFLESARPFKLSSFHSDSELLFYGVHLFPGDSLHLDIDGGEVKASGSGEIHYRIKEEISSLNISYRNTDYGSLAHEEYIATIQSELNSKLQVVEEHFEIGHINVAELQYYQSIFETDFMISYVQYAWRKSDITSEFYSPQSIDSFTLGIPIEREEFLSNPVYIHFLDQFNYAFLAAARNEASNSLANHKLWQYKFQLPRESFRVVPELYYLTTITSSKIPFSLA